MTAFSIKILSLSGEMVILRILFDITKKISMLKEDGSINGDRFSDHLPLTFSMNI